MRIKIELVFALSLLSTSFELTGQEASKLKFFMLILFMFSAIICLIYYIPVVSRVITKNEQSPSAPLSWLRHATAFSLQKQAKQTVYS